MKRCLVLAVSVVLVLAACGGAETAIVENVEPLAVPDGGTLFTLMEGSAVAFAIEEELRGSSNTVVGVNTNVAGQVVIDESDLSLLDAATITIGAGDFVTDNAQRNGAIDRFVLDTNRYPQILFDIESISSEGIVVGSLTVKDVTQEVAFAVEVTEQGPGAVTLVGVADVGRSDFGLSIPSVPFVADVSDSVTLQFEFVLEAKG